MFDRIKLNKRKRNTDDIEIVPERMTRGRASTRSREEGRSHNSNSRSYDAIETTRLYGVREENKVEFAKMETSEEKKKRQEEEEKLLKRLMKQSRLGAIVHERQKRMELLMRLTDDQQVSSRSSDDEIEKIYNEKKQRTEEIKRCLFISRQEDARNANYFDETTLKNENGEPEYKVTSMIMILKLKEGIGSIRPINININYAINEEEFEKDIRFIRDEDIRETEDTVKWIEPQNQSKQNIEDDQRTKEKPRIIENFIINNLTYRWRTTP